MLFLLQHKALNHYFPPVLVRIHLKKEKEKKKKLKISEIGALTTSSLYQQDGAEQCRGLPVSAAIKLGPHAEPPKQGTEMGAHTELWVRPFLPRPLR